MSSKFIDSFCESKDWNANVFSKFALDKLTPCFEDIVILGILHITMIVFGFIRVYQLRSPKYTRVKMKSYSMHYVKMCLVAIVTIVPLLQLNGKIGSTSVSAFGGAIAPFQVVALLLETAAWLFMMILLIMEINHDVRAGSWIFRFLTIFALACSTIKLYFVVRMSRDDGYFFILFMADFSGKALLALISATYFPKRSAFTLVSQGQEEAALQQQQQRRALSAKELNYTSLAGDAEEAAAEEAAASANVCPEYSSSLFSRLVFGWLNPLMTAGYKHPLQADDVWVVDPEDTADQLRDRLAVNWAAERRAHPDSPSLARALFATFGRRFMWGAVFKLFNDASQFVGPIFLSLFIKYLQNNTIPQWRGWLYAFSIFAGQLAGALGECQYFQVVMRVGLNVRSAIVATIFQKAMILTQDARRERSSGAITNLVTSDAQNLQQVCQNAHTVWSAPLRIIIALAMLYGQLGPSAFVGLAVLILAMPLQKRFVSKTGALLKKGLGKTDERVKLVNEVMSSMSVVKCYSWEDSFCSKIEEVRTEELGWFRKNKYLSAFNSFMISSIPILVSVGTFAVFASYHEFTPAVAFTSLSLFGVLRMPLFTLPNVITQLTSAKVSLGRLTSFLLLSELPLQPFPPSEDAPTLSPRTHTAPFRKQAVVPFAEVEAMAAEAGGDTLPFAAGSVIEAAPVPIAVSIDPDATFAWEPSAVQPTLTNCPLRVPKGSLVAIIGSTGHGKSSLLSAVLGDIECLNRRPEDAVSVYGSVAYVPQQSWIFNATLRENITFGLPYARRKYRNAVATAAMTRDLTLLAAGDKTEIGEKGVNLSGGQKQRVSIARAVYSEADVYLMDDPLSALDAHVARQVFDDCIRRQLAHTTRLLVTNRLEFVADADYVVMMKDGSVECAGTYAELRHHNSEFDMLMAQQEQGAEQEEEEGEEGNKGVFATIAEAVTDAVDDLTGDDAAAAAGSASAKGKGESESKLGGGDDDSSHGDASTDGAGEEEKDGEGVGKLIQAEAREEGAVSWTVVRRYIAAMGGYRWFLSIMALYIFVEGCRLGSSLWITVWSAGGLGSGYGAAFYIAVYAAISVGQAATNMCNLFLQARAGLAAGQAMHEGMLKALLRAPMSFFNSTPLGRILNRFSKDTADIDLRLAPMSSMFLRGMMQLMGTFIIIGTTTPYTLAVFAPILCVFYWCQRYFQCTSRELKRLDSISRSPVYAHFSQSLNGISTIRAYRAGDRMAAVSATRLDNNIRMNLASFSANRWLSVRLETAGGMLILSAAVFLVVGRRVLSPAQAGLQLSYALQITGLLNMAVRLASVAENAFNAVERVGEYSDVDSEAPLVIEESRPPASWPEQGGVEFSQLRARYRPDLPCVLNGLTFNIEPAQKVGIVGRTGAGKSSLFLTLFRIMERDSGSITIDGRDIAHMGLRDLRSNLSIIPQEPVLFTGTVRANLDPFSAHSDAVLWEALARAHLKPFIASQAGGLDMVVTEDGSNFSVGQRQLLCLARALLTRAKVLVLDEATAAVDVRTDALIQSTIREAFAHCTTLTIAHRLNTIMDSDRILVMDAGRCLEYDTPAALVDLPQGAFASMVDDTGEESARFLRAVARGEVDYNTTLSSVLASEEEVESESIAPAASDAPFVVTADGGGEGEQKRSGSLTAAGSASPVRGLARLKSMNTFYSELNQVEEVNDSEDSTPRQPTAVASPLEQVHGALITLRSALAALNADTADAAGEQGMDNAAIASAAAWDATLRANKLSKDLWTAQLARFLGDLSSDAQKSANAAQNRYAARRAAETQDGDGEQQEMLMAMALVRS